MSEWTDASNELLQSLKRERDELRLELKLASMEFRDQWNAAEKKWQHLERKAEGVGLEAAASIDEIAHEIARSYRRMRDIVKN
jgi:hypothetical protein